MSRGRHVRSAARLPRCYSEYRIKAAPAARLIDLGAPEAQRDIGRLLMQRCNWERPHQFRVGLPPAVTEGKLN